MAAALEHLCCGSLTRVIAFTSTSIVTKANSEIEAERESVRLWAEAEQQFILVCERFGIQWTVLRPTMMYDEGRDANITRLSAYIERFGFIPMAAPARDCASQFMRRSGNRLTCGCRQLCSGQQDLCNSGATITYREMVGRIFDGMNRRRRIALCLRRYGGAAFALARPFSPMRTSPWVIVCRRIWF
jgi:hypothetical protein